MPKTVYLNTPISEEEVRGLRLDDEVYLTGEAYTLLYEEHFTRIMDAVGAGEPLPMRLRNGAVYHTGVLYRKTPEGRFEYRAVGATTSAKYNALTPEFIRLTGIRAMIGKGGMDKATQDALQARGCVYLAIAGGCSAFYAPLARLEEEFWPELSPLDNQRLKLRLAAFGPLVVAMDAHGNSLYEEAAATTKARRAAICERLGIEA